MNVAELLLPALRWDAERGYSAQRELIDDALELGVGGFIFFGGPASEVRALAGELRERSRVPLLLGADLERGAGQQFSGKTGLPPLAALGAIGDVEVMRRAAALTAREARELGINWVYAPVLDLDIEPDNPIVGTRAIGGDPGAVARLGAAWIEGCQSEHVLACGKHFPGHGRTTTDSHAELPVVDAAQGTLDREDLLPFRAAARAGVASLMTAHVAFPALDPSGAPATLSRPILRGLLREQLGFDGLIVTDALIMAGVRQQESEARASVKALAAGCDLLLYPEDVNGILAEIEASTAAGELDDAALERSAARRGEWARWAAEGDSRGSSADDQLFAEEIARRAVHVVQGEVPRLSSEVELTVVDDDLGGPYPPPSREPFSAALRELGVSVRKTGNGAPVHIVALFGDIRAWKGRPGYSPRALAEVRTAAGSGNAVSTVVVQFSHPRLASTLQLDTPIVSAWGGEAPMQRAAAAWLVRGNTL